MFNLIKYEWMKRWKFFLAGLVLFVLADIDLVSRVLSKSSPTKLSVLFISLLFAMFLALIFDHITRFHKSLFTDEGYFFFSIPLSGYRLLGSKLLAVIMEVIAISFFVLMVLLIDYKFLSSMLLPLTSNLDVDIYMFAAKLFVFFLLGYLTFLLMVYLAMVLAKTVFASVKYGKLISFISFIILSKIVGSINASLELFNKYPNFQATNINPNWGVAIGIAGVLFGVTGYLMDRKINL